MPNPPRNLLRFDEFEVDLRAGELRRASRLIPLQEKPFQLLGALIESPGKVVLREELRARLWDDKTFVDFDNNLNAAAKKLRDALGDSAETPRFIETVPRRGYRFRAPVEQTAPSAPTTRRRFPRLALVVGLVLIAVLTVYLISVVPTSTLATTTKTMLAVVPFDNLSDDAEQEYFVDGLTEDGAGPRRDHQYPGLHGVPAGPLPVEQVQHRRLPGGDRTLRKRAGGRCELRLGPGESPTPTTCWRSPGS